MLTLNPEGTGAPLTLLPDVLDDQNDKFNYKVLYKHYKRLPLYQKPVGSMLKVYVVARSSILMNFCVWEQIEKKIF